MLYLWRVERFFWIVGTLCACWWLFCVSQARGYHDAPTPPPASSTGLSASGAVLGRLEIPALGLSVPVLEDDETKSLLRGVGHIRGTAMLGGLGTTALAGHRDTFLRPIRRVVPNMQIRAISPNGVYHYIVDSTEIVHPEAVEVLEIRDKPELVLITCYPFDYIGAAPERFIVHAHLVSAAPDPLPPK